MGLNIEEHGRWSMPRVWGDYFKIHSWEKKKITDMLKVWECKNKICGHYNLEGTLYNEELDCNFYFYIVKLLHLHFWQNLPIANE